MRKLFLIFFCLASALWVFSSASAAGADVHPRGPAVETDSNWLLPLMPNPNPPQKPLPTEAPVTKTNKLIIVSLSSQTLKYFEDTKMVGEFKISSGIKNTPTPAGQFSVLDKKPLVHYKGANYDFPKTKWNLMFKHGSRGNLYIHGAYWHHNFGHPMSHGCVNVSYADMEGLYNWTDVGTEVIIE